MHDTTENGWEQAVYATMELAMEARDTHNAALPNDDSAGLDVYPYRQYGGRVWEWTLLPWGDNWGRELIEQYELDTGNEW